MSFQIRYTDKSGRALTHTYRGTVGGAKGWAESLSRENNGNRAECVEIADGPYDHSGSETHVITVGHGPKK